MVTILLAVFLAVFILRSRNFTQNSLLAKSQQQITIGATDKESQRLPLLDNDEYGSDDRSNGDEAVSIKDGDKLQLSNVQTTPEVSNVQDHDRVTSTDEAPTMNDTTEDQLASTDEAPAIKNTTDDQLASTDEAPVIKDTSDDQLASTDEASTTADHNVTTPENNAEDSVHVNSTSDHDITTNTTEKTYIDDSHQDDDQGDVELNTQDSERPSNETTEQSESISTSDEKSDITSEHIDNSSLTTSTEITNETMENAGRTERTDFSEKLEDSEEKTEEEQNVDKSTTIDQGEYESLANSDRIVPLDNSRRQGDESSDISSETVRTELSTNTEPAEHKEEIFDEATSEDASAVTKQDDEGDMSAESDAATTVRTESDDATQDSSITYIPTGQ